MATATVIKPDHAATRKHLLFTDEHEDLRESMEAWVKKELWPHRNEWEETTWPNEAMRRAGELGYLGLCFPEEYGGQGGDYYYSLVRAECMSYSGSGGTNMGFAVQTDMVLPPVHLLGTEEQKQRYLVPGIKGEKIGCLGITEPGAGSDVAGIRTKAIRDGDDYLITRLEDLHHQRRRGRTSSSWSRRPTPTRATRGSRCSWSTCATTTATTCPASRSRASWRRWACTPPTPASSPSTRSASPPTPCSARSARASTTSPGSSRASAWSPPRAAYAGAERMFEKTLEYAKEREAFGRPIGRFQAIRHKFAEMATKIEAAKQFTYVDRLALRERRVPGARDHRGEAVRLADVLRGRRRVRPDPRRLRLHEGVRDRARLPRRPPQPDRRRAPTRSCST